MNSLVAAAFLFLTVQMERPPNEVLNIVVGQTKVVGAPNVREAAVGDATIADVKASGNRLLVTGLQRGSTNLTLIGPQGRMEYLVRVLAEDPAVLAHDVGELLKGTQGVTLRVVGDRVVLSGEIYRESDANRIKLIQELYPQVFSLAELKTIHIDRMVQLDVKLMEVSSQALRQFGLNWGDSLPLQASAGLEAPIAIGNGGLGPWAGNLSIVTNFHSILQFMLEDRVARVLSNPVILTKNGSEASFQAGGEIPIPVNQGLGQTTVEWKKFGILLSFLPRIDPYGNVLLKISAESSELDFGRGVNMGGLTIPALNTRRTNNEVNLTVGETLVLAELVNSREAKEVGKIAGLGQIPIIGEFFKSRTLRDDDARFFVFITPRVVAPGEQTDENIRKHLRIYEDAGERIEGSILD